MKDLEIKKLKQKEEREMRKMFLVAMITISLICCGSVAWSFWPFTNNDNKKTHESLDVVVETGAETARDVKQIKNDLSKLKNGKTKQGAQGINEIKKDLDKAKKDLRNLADEAKKTQQQIEGLNRDARKNGEAITSTIKSLKSEVQRTRKELLIASLVLLILLLLVLLIVLVGRKRTKKKGEIKTEETQDKDEKNNALPKEEYGRCSICGRLVKPVNWKRHLKRSACGKNAELLMENQRKNIS